MEDSKIKFFNGSEIPAIGFGTWMIKDPEVLENALEAALKAGYRHIDTAFLYGNEKIIGNVLKRWFEQGRLTREEIFVTTKLPVNGMNPLKVIHFLQQSLERLQLSYVDLYLIHFPFGVNYIDDDTVFPFKEGKLDLDVSTDLIGIWQEMENTVDAGLAKSIGLSNFNGEQVERIFNEAKIHPANLQVEMHVYFQQRELRDLCKKLGITLTAYAPLGSPGRAPLHAVLHAPFNDVGLLVDPVVTEIATKQNKTPAQILVKYLLNQNVVVLCKSINPERVRENIDVFNFELSPEDASRLEKLDKGVQGRSFTWTILRGATEHPEYPFNEINSGE